MRAYRELGPCQRGQAAGAVLRETHCQDCKPKSKEGRRKELPHISFLSPSDFLPVFAVDWTQSEEAGKGVLVMQSIMVKCQDTEHTRMAKDGSERWGGQWRKTGRVTLTWHLNKVWRKWNNEPCLYLEDRIF